MRKRCSLLIAATVSQGKTSVHVCMCAWIYISMYVCMFACMPACMYVHMYVCMHVYMCARMYVCFKIFFSTVSEDACRLSDGMRVLLRSSEMPRAV